MAKMTKFYCTCIYEEGHGPVFKDSLRRVECVEATSIFEAEALFLDIPHVVKIFGNIQSEDEIKAVYDGDGKLQMFLAD